MTVEQIYQLVVMPNFSQKGLNGAPTTSEKLSVEKQNKIKQKAICIKSIRLLR